LVFFAWVLVVQLIGLGVFTKGFFLTRVELPHKSECDIRSLLTAEEIDHLSDAAGVASREDVSVDGKWCWIPHRFKRVVWVVIDALRFDFAA
ncbi:unnamed protein product, partial [Discosporangium mesarthrocarpum]